VVYTGKGGMEREGGSQIVTAIKQRRVIRSEKKISGGNNQSEEKNGLPIE